MRTWAIVIGLVVCASSARAQDGTAEPATGAVPAAPAATDPAVEPEATPGEAAAQPGPAEPAATGAAEPPATRSVAPKVAVVIVGDPDPVLVAAAREIEARALVSEDLRLPSDPSLRATLRGEAGDDDDGLEEVRRERRRLGLGESSDAPILQRLGRRAGAVAVIVVRSTATGAEAVVLDVRSGQFFEGSLPMIEPDPDAIVPFAARRARLAARAAAQSDASGTAQVPPVQGAGTDSIEGPAPVTAAPGATEAPDDGQDAGEWMEENWPYFAAGALLAAAIVFVAVVASDGGEPPPMLRFQPGTP